jgi:hypothetical protein
MNRGAAAGILPICDRLTDRHMSRGLNVDGEELTVALQVLVALNAVFESEQVGTYRLQNVSWI